MATQLSTVSAHESALRRNACHSWLSGHRPLRSVRESLEALLQAPGTDLPVDLYGSGALFEWFEGEAAAVLGKPKARFLHKGMAAQMAAMQVWTAGHARPTVAVHRQSHVEMDESQAPEALLGLRTLRMGRVDRAPTLADVLALRETPTMLVVELPLRRAGWVLPEWDELLALRAWCQQEGVILHLDGARIWEAAAGYDRTPADVAALGDSVYASLYKGLGALAGCILACSEEFIRRTAVWTSRLACNLYSAYPYVLGGLQGLRTQLPRMGEYRDRARALAAALSDTPGLRVHPVQPPTNSFQLHLAMEPDRLDAALRRAAEEDGWWLASACQPSSQAGWSMIEIVIGDASDNWQVPQAAQRLAGLLRPPD